MKNNIISKEQNSNFELLKIILILMIIVLHYFNSSMGGLLANVNNGSINYYLAHFLESLCIIAANVFIIITGYFSYKKTSINISKPIKLFALTVFYGIIISVLAVLFIGLNINLSLIRQIIVSTFNRWFVVIYCILYLLIPYINKLINSLTKKQFENLLIINIIFFYIWYTFFTNITITDNGYGIINFINLYLIGAYIRMYNDNYVPKKTSITIFIVCTLLTTIFSFFTKRAWSYCTIFNLISSIALFQIFKSLKIKNNKFINQLATYTFSTYIIHEHYFLVNILYRKLFHSNNYWNSNLMILNLIITVIGIYLICIIIEFNRRLILKKIFDNKLDKIKYSIKC